MIDLARERVCLGSGKNVWMVALLTAPSTCFGFSIGLLNLQGAQGGQGQAGPTVVLSILCYSAFAFLPENLRRRPG